MTEREQRSVRKYKREHARSSRKRKRALMEQHELEMHSAKETISNDHDSEMTPITGLSGNEVNDVRKVRGLHMRRKHLKELGAKIKSLETKLRESRLKEKATLKRLHREESKSCTRSEKELTPRTRVAKMVGKENISSNVKKQLLFGEVLKDQIKSSCKKKVKVRQVVGRVLYGNVVKKYKCVERVRGYFDVTPNSRLVKNECYLNYNRRSEGKTMFLNEKIVRFYEENSRMLPGKKYFKKKRGVRKQLMYLNDTVASLYKKFCVTNRTVRVSYTVFARRRPFWTVPPKVSARDTCLCVTHENMKLMLDKFKAIGLLPSSKRNELTNLIVCDKVTEDCSLRKCASCKGKKISFASLPGDTEISYPQWLTKTEDRVSAKTKKNIKVKVTIKEIVNSSVESLKSNFQKDFEHYIAHCLRVEKQASTLGRLKETLQETDLLVHVDFSENYNCKYGKEPHSFHFGGSRHMLTLHTGMLYSKNFSRGFVTLSDSLRHDASAVVAHLKPILDKVLKDRPKITTIHILSDGPSTQYRNKSMFYLISKCLPKMYRNIQIIVYNYSEAGHGKGAADGIGGSVKRILDSCVAHGEDVHNLDTAVAALRKHCKNLTIDTISEEDIVAIDGQLPLLLTAFTGTMKVHQFKWVRGKPMLKFNSLSCYSCAPAEMCSHYSIGEKPVNVTTEKPNVTTEKPVPKSRKRKASAKIPEAPKTKKSKKS